MSTDSQTDPEDERVLDAFADAWAAVYIDVYEKLKASGELGDDPSEAPAGEKQ